MVARGSVSTISRTVVRISAASVRKKKVAKAAAHAAAASSVVATGDNAAGVVGLVAAGQS
jgi:hypothetical protein